ncbi:MAG: proline--tRNA ligase [Conexivisphaera sp.]
MSEQTPGSAPEAPLPDKGEDLSSWYDEVLERAELIDIRYGVKGFIVYRPNAMRIIKRIYSMFEEELERGGHMPMLLPLVIPMANFRRETEHVKGFEDQVFYITEAGGNALEEKLVVRPTSETAIYPMFSLWVHSYSDLPMKLYQSVAVYRYETKATRPLLRGREFLWIETHDVFEDEAGARSQIQEDLRVARRVYDSLGLAFLVVEREPYDKFPGAESSYAYDALLPNGSVLQIATTHYLGDHFTRAFEVKFTDREGNQRYPRSTCFGIGISRTLAALIMTHGDRYGLVLPFGLSVLDVVIVPIVRKGSVEDVVSKSRRLEEELRAAGFNARLDDSEDTPGDKFYRWEMLGVPVRVEVGKREVEGGYVTLFRRDTRTRERVRDADLIARLRELSAEISENLRRRAWERLNSSISDAATRDDVIRLAREGRIIRANFCGREECALEIKRETGYDVRGKRIDVEERPTGNCAWCGRPASRVVYMAKAY